MGTTTDPNDPRLKNVGPDGMQETYLVLSEADRSKGYVEPVRHSYKHVGAAGPVYPLRDLTPEEQERYQGSGYVAYEEYLRHVPADADYPPYDDASSVVGSFWTAERLANVGKGCGVVTRMGDSIAETYARSPGYYGATYCAGCKTHLPVGPQGEFVWVENDQPTTQRVGTLRSATSRR